MKLKFLFTSACLLLAGMWCGLDSLAADAAPPIILIPAKNLDAFYPFTKDHGVNNDPKNVFTLTNGLLHITGEEQGYLATKADYSSYRLIAEYKWGALPAGQTERDSGVFIHGQGPDRFFMAATECTLYSGSNWVSGQVGRVAPNSVKNRENAIGEWNTLEILSEGSRLQVRLNGHVVTELTDAVRQSGKVLLQSRWGEVFFRRLELLPLDKTGAANTDGQPKPDLKYGLCINFGLQTFARPGEQGELPASRFAPASVNVKSWARAAKEAGMTFAVPTVKLGGGFCLWQTTDSDYDIAHSPFKGDILGDFIAACNAGGILPGAFYAAADAHNEGAGRTAVPVPNLYFNFIKKQITELHTKYPGLRVQIFGGSDRFSAEQWADLVQLVHRVNPQCVILDLKHEGVTQFGGGTVLKGWRWQPNAELVPAAELFRLYNQTQTAKKTLWLTVGADPSGNIPNDQLAVLSQLKEMIANPPPVQTTTAPDAKPDAAERLKKVKALYDQGLINKEDYDKKVKEIVDSL